MEINYTADIIVHKDISSLFPDSHTTIGRLFGTTGEKSGVGPTIVLGLLGTGVRTSTPGLLFSISIIRKLSNAFWNARFKTDT